MRTTHHPIDPNHNQISRRSFFATSAAVAATGLTSSAVLGLFESKEQARLRKLQNIDLSDPVSASQAIANLYNLDSNNTIENGFSQIENSVKDLLARRGLANIRKPDQYQSIAICWAIFEVITSGYPYKLNEKFDVENLLNVFREQVSDCDTRAYLLFSLNKRLKLGLDLSYVFIPRHGFARMNFTDRSKNLSHRDLYPRFMTDYINVETNTGELGFRPWSNQRYQDRLYQDAVTDLENEAEEFMLQNILSRFVIEESTPPRIRRMIADDSQKLPHAERQKALIDMLFNPPVTTPLEAWEPAKMTEKENQARPIQMKIVMRRESIKPCDREVITMIDDFLAKYPEAKEMFLYRAMANIDINQLDKAKDDLKRYDEAGLARDAERLNVELEIEQDPKKRTALITDLLNLMPCDSELLLDRSKLYLNQGLKTEALADLRLVTFLAREHAREYLALAKELGQENRAKRDIWNLGLKV